MISGAGGRRRVESGLIISNRGRSRWSGPPRRPPETPSSWQRPSRTAGDRRGA